jgi:DNA repair exonuclease SbcCD ATPase subunit
MKSRHEGTSRALSSNKHASHMYGDTSNLGQRDDAADLKAEEKKEISSNLTMLRKKYDEFREASMKKEKEIALMRDELDKLKGVETGLRDDSDRYTGRLGQLKNNLDTAKLKLEEAVMNRKTYEHMLERMKVPHIFCLRVSHHRSRKTRFPTS